MRSAAEHMPRVDAIGVSSAGVYVDNRIMVASLFLKVGKEDFEKMLSDAVSARSAEELKTGLGALLQTEYGVAPQDCEIRVELSDTGELARIAVFLSGKALTVDPRKIEQDLYERFVCVVEVR